MALATAPILDSASPEVPDVRSHVGNWGLNGLVMLTLSFVDPDPLRKSNGWICCDAQREAIEGLDGDPLPPRQGTEVAFQFLLDDDLFGKRVSGCRRFRLKRLTQERASYWRAKRTSPDTQRWRDSVGPKADLSPLTFSLGDARPDGSE